MRHEAVVNEIKTGEFDGFNDTLDITVGYTETSPRFPSKYDDRDGRYSVGAEIAKTSELAIHVMREPDGWYEIKIKSYSDWTPTAEIDRVNNDQKFAGLREALGNGHNGIINARIALEIQADLLESGWEPSEQSASVRDKIIANITRQVHDQLAAIQKKY